MTGTVLLTGATGFVGRHIFRRLAERGLPVRVVVRRGKEEVFAGDPATESVVATNDLFAETPPWWEQVLSGVDTVIHAAWYVQPGKYNLPEANMACVTGTLALARAAAGRVRRFVGIGTCFEYDLGAGVLSVDTPLRPSSPYGAAKAATFLALNGLMPPSGTSFLWCRLFFLHGEGEPPQRLFPYIREQLSRGEVAELTSGEQTRDYMDVADAAERIVAEAAGTTTGAFNICSGQGATVRDIALKIADEYGRRDLLRFGARPPNEIDPPVIVGVPGGSGDGPEG